MCVWLALGPGTSTSATEAYRTSCHKQYCGLVPPRAGNLLQTLWHKKVHVWLTSRPEWKLVAWNDTLLQTIRSHHQCTNAATRGAIARHGMSYALLHKTQSLRLRHAGAVVRIDISGNVAAAAAIDCKLDWVEGASKRNGVHLPTTLLVIASDQETSHEVILVVVCNHAK